MQLTKMYKRMKENDEGRADTENERITVLRTWLDWWWSPCDDEAIGEEEKLQRHRYHHHSTTNEQVA